MSGPGDDSEPILSVAGLTDQLRGMLGTTFGDVWVRGEISQPRRPASGHLYLTLKDDEAVLPAVLWRSTVARLRFRPEEGQEVIVRGGVDVYPPHGRYQLIIRSMEPVGEGALRLAFEQMRRRLAAEGLFEAERKQPLPHLPRRIALVTSRTGAAVRDMVSVIRRRFEPVTILLLSARVQGQGAAEEIVAALRHADESAQADVIIVGRGGGSLEDLWAFNEEVVARAIAACRTPVVSAVGHETDTTIADLVADVRAATPSQAGELVVPVRAELVERLDHQQARLARQMRVRLERAWQRLEALGDRPVLRSPEALLTPVRGRVDGLAVRLEARSPRAALRRRRESLASLEARLHAPLGRRLERERRQLARVAAELDRGLQGGLLRARRRVESLDTALRALSPLAVLGRGYSLTTQLDEAGQAVGVLRGAADVRPGDRLHTRLADGSGLESRVERVFRDAASADIMGDPSPVEED